MPWGAPGPALPVGERRGCPLCSSLCSLTSSTYWVRVWAPQYKKDIKLLDTFQRKATEVVKGLQGKIHEEWLRLLGVFSPEQRS